MRDAPMHLTIDALMAEPAPCESCDLADTCGTELRQVLTVEILFFRTSRSGKPVPTDKVRYFPAHTNHHTIHRWLARFGNKLIRAVVYSDRFQISECRKFVDYYLRVT